MHLIHTGILILCSFHVIAAKSHAKICSVKEPNTAQVCVTIKFPWVAEPVHFCTDHRNLNYVPQCTGPSESRHCHDDGRNDTLKIATPWDCCPIISTPNYCVNVECPPEPFNRTCKQIKTLGACCPTYFCEKGSPDSCKSRRLNPSCLHAPKEKAHCLKFRDPYGCCNTFQCPGEGKPGTCPRRKDHARKLRQSKEDKGTFRNTVDTIVDGAKTTVHHASVQFKSTLETHGGAVGRAVAPYIPTPFKPEEKPRESILRCSGDHTCPGSMKCCPTDPVGYSVHHHKIRHERMNGVKVTTAHRMRAELPALNHQGPHNHIDGVCMEPIDGVSPVMTSTIAPSGGVASSSSFPTVSTEAPGTSPPTSRRTRAPRKNTRRVTTTTAAPPTTTTAATTTTAKSTTAAPTTQAATTTTTRTPVTTTSTPAPTTTATTTTTTTTTTTAPPTTTVRATKPTTTAPATTTTVKSTTTAPTPTTTSPTPTPELSTTLKAVAATLATTKPPAPFHPKVPNHPQPIITRNPKSISAGGNSGEHNDVQNTIVSE